jgi:hypothetical protein
MSHSPNPKKIDELLAVAVDLQPRPDFAAWRQNHPEAVAALQSLPVILSKRRSKMIRIARYSTSVAAVLLVAVAAWWMFLSSSTAAAWAQVIEQLLRARNATCQLTFYRGGETTDKVYIEGDRTRYEGVGTIGIADFRTGKLLELNTSTKKATLRDLVKDSDGHAIRRSNLLADLLKLKDAASKVLPDEGAGGVLCHVYRVDKPVLLGWDVPWVKLWIDPRTNLPTQVHTLVADGQIAVTYHDFLWNEPLDESLFSLVPPKGYELVDEKAQKAKKARKAISMQEAVAVLDAAEGGAILGRELRGEEATKALDMLGQQIESNFKAIKSWSGTYRLDIQPPTPPQVSHVMIEFSVEPGRDRIRTDYREVRQPQAPLKPASPQTREDSLRTLPPPVFEPREWRWVRTAEESLQFPMNELRGRVAGFPQAGSDPAHPFRIVYREGPGATHHYDRYTFVDPRTFLDGDGGAPYWEVCTWNASALRGERGDNSDYAKKNVIVRQRRNGTATEYVLFIRYRGSEDDVSDNVISKTVFSSQSGFNVVSRRSYMRSRLYRSEQCRFRQEKGVFIPERIEYRQYQLPSVKGSTGAMTSDRVFTLQQSKVNEPIDPAVFEISSLGLRRGDRMADWIERRAQVFDGKRFVPAEQFNAGQQGRK